MGGWQQVHAGNREVGRRAIRWQVRTKPPTIRKHSMTGLARTDLATSRKVHLAAQAVARQGQYGAVSQLASAFDVSRPTVLAARGQADRVLTAHFANDVAEVVQISVDPRQLERAVLALRVVGQNSVRAIMDLLPVLYPGLGLSYGTIQAMLVRAEQRAAVHNAGVDLSTIKAAAVDEMFSQGDPVLAGVDLDSGFLFSLEHRTSRGGADWADVLGAAHKQGLNLQTVVKDAARGIAAGVTAVFPLAEQRDDCFHAHYIMSKALRILENRAYGAITAEVDLERQITRLATGKQAATETVKPLRARLEGVKQRCREKIDLYDAFLVATERAREAIEIIDLDTGTLRTPEQMQTEVLAAAATMQGLDDHHARKVATYMTNRAPGLVTYAVELRTQLDALSALEGADVVLLAVMVLRLLSLVRSKSPRRRSPANQHQLMAAWHLLKQQPRAAEVLAAVEELNIRRHRASSAIEGFNAALRPHLYVHKSVTQGFLELFRAHFNLRQRRWGRHKGTSAHALVTGVPVTDWLATLGYPATAEIN